MASPSRRTSPGAAPTEPGPSMPTPISARGRRFRPVGVDEDAAMPSPGGVRRRQSSKGSPLQAEKSPARMHGSLPLASPKSGVRRRNSKAEADDQLAEAEVEELNAPEPSLKKQRQAGVGELANGSVRGAAASPKDAASDIAMEDAKVLKPRMRVIVDGLVSRADINGQAGTLGQFQYLEDRWRVRLDIGEEVNVRADNISPDPHAPSTPMRRATTPKVLGKGSPKGGQAMHVIVVGLRGRSDLNGLVAVLQNESYGEDRFHVKMLSGESVNVKAENLRLALWAELREGRLKAKEAKAHAKMEANNHDGEDDEAALQVATKKRPAAAKSQEVAEDDDESEELQLVTKKKPAARSSRGKISEVEQDSDQDEGAEDEDESEDEDQSEVEAPQKSPMRAAMKVAQKAPTKVAMKVAMKMAMKTKVPVKCPPPAMKGMKASASKAATKKAMKR